jgi:hypothetical protein
MKHALRLSFSELFRRYQTHITTIFLIGFVTATNLQAQTEAVWESEFPTVGVYSSLRAADLNQDDIKDLIVKMLIRIKP